MPLAPFSGKSPIPDTYTFVVAAALGLALGGLLSLFFDRFALPTRIPFQFTIGGFSTGVLLTNLVLAVIVGSSVCPSASDPMGSCCRRANGWAWRRSNPFRGAGWRGRRSTDMPSYSWDRKAAHSCWWVRSVDPRRHCSHDRVVSITDD